MGDSGGGALATLAAMGVTYWIGMALADLALLALVGAAAAVLILGGVLIYALISWVKCLKQAYRTGNKEWVHDLFGAPMAGLIVGAILCKPAEHWSQTAGQAWIDAHINSPSAPIYMKLLPVACFIVFVYFLVATPTALANGKDRGARFLAYPGFIFYTVYLMAAVVYLTDK